MDLVWYRRYRKANGTQEFVSWETSEGTETYEAAAAPARTLKAVADVIGFDLPETTARSANNFVHWATGIGWGKVHGIVSSILGTSSPALGPVTAVLAWATSYAVLPKLGVYKSISEYDKDTLLQDLTAHLAFGAVLGVTYRVLAGDSA